jgi:hypothetical protein
MSAAAKRVRVPLDADSRALKGHNPKRLPRINESSGSTLPREQHPAPWLPVTRRPKPRKLILLRLVGGVWIFRDPGNTHLYRREIDPDGSERWSCKVIRTEREWISQSDAARLIGVSRQAIGRAIVFKRLSAMDCNGKSVVSRAEVLALKIDLKRRRCRTL